MMDVTVDSKDLHARLEPSNSLSLLQSSGPLVYNYAMATMCKEHGETHFCRSAMTCSLDALLPIGKTDSQ